MEKLTSEANARSQAVDRLQGLEAKLEKLTNEKASLEARGKKVKEEASQVSGEVWARLGASRPGLIRGRFLSRQLHSFRRTLALCTWRSRTWRKGSRSQPHWPTVI